MNLGQKIGVFAPSSFIEEADIEKAKSFIEQRGFEVFVHPQIFARHHQSAGTVQEKLDALHDLYSDSSIDCVWAAGGGNRSSQLLEHIDYKLIRSNKKPMIGFSDVTSLLNAITVKTEIINVHGPVFKNLSQYQEIDILLGNDYSMPLVNAHIVKEGEAQGALFGGNLSVFQYLPSLLGKDFLEGSILFLEDCNEELSRIDRMLAYLKNFGAFDQINALILGQFNNLQDSERPFGFSLEDIVREHLDELNIPVIMNAPFGHGQNLHPFPIGQTVQLNDKALITL